MKKMIELQKLMDWGFLFGVFSGIQIDINVVLRMLNGMMVEALMCDHNCMENVGGGYNCPSAFSLNKGLQKKYLASLESIVRWIEVAAQGLRLARDQFLENDGGFYERFKIPSVAQEFMRDNVRTETIGINLFGGNSELHPCIIKLIMRLRELGYIVNVTTTGGLLLKKESFAIAMRKFPPHILAVSTDDFEIKRLKDLLKLDLDALKKEWNKIPPDHGQEQKFIEGVYAAKLFADGDGPRVLFNMVIHKKNIAHINNLIDALANQFPNVLINPYPMQSSFLYQEDFFDDIELALFHKFVDHMIKQTMKGVPHITKRLHYWLVMKSVFLTYKNDMDNIRKMVAGYGTWKCYTNPQIPYLQIGRGQKGQIITDGVAGGKLGCFWNNETVTDTTCITSAEQVSDYLSGGMKLRAKQSLHPCPGCNMPRLWFNMISTLNGLADELIPEYLLLQKKYLGF